MYLPLSRDDEVVERALILVLVAIVVIAIRVALDPQNQEIILKLDSDRKEEN